jgi:hypothetical protein
MTQRMSKQLAISSALSVLMMATFALLGPNAVRMSASMTNPIGTAHAAPAR